MHRVLALKKPFGSWAFARRISSRGILLTALAVCGIAYAGAAEEAEERAEEFIEELLSYKAPPRDWSQYLKAHPRILERPPATADAVTLLNYWRYAPEDSSPDREMQSRLLEIVERDPASAGALLRWLPTDDVKIHDRLKQVEEGQSREKTPEAESIAAELRDWLMLHSRYFRDELKREVLWPDDVAGASAAAAMAAFVKLDPVGARSFFLEQAKSAEAKDRAIAWGGLMTHFSSQATAETQDEWRAELKALTTDSKADLSARRIALLAVMREPWDGRDSWFLNLFDDPTLAVFQQDSGRSMTILGELVFINPDYWIPKISPFVRSTGPRRTNTAYGLIWFPSDEARADAVRPLLPWIAKRDWAPDSEKVNGRLRVLQSLDQVDLPESVPALLEAAETATGYELAAIADDLAHYHARQAIPVLKKALAREREEYQRRHVVESLHGLGGFSPEEIVEALRAYAIMIATEAGENEVRAAEEILPKKTLTPRQSIGDQFARMEITDPVIIEQIGQAARELRSTNPAAANTLRRIQARCASGQAIDLVAEQLRAEDFIAAWARELLDKKGSLGATLPALQGLRGPALGLQTALLRDPARILQVLTGDDRLAKLALVASARLAGVALPIAQIEPLLTSADATASRAAQLYLEANDSPEARAVVWRRVSPKPVILGSRPDTDPGHFTFGPLGKTEKELVQSIQQPHGPNEVMALLSEGYWGGRGQSVLYHFPDRFVLRADDGNGRWRERAVPAAEANALAAWLEEQRIDDLPPYDEGAFDGIQYEYFRASATTARRVFMNNPPGAPMGLASVHPGVEEDRPDPWIYSELTQRFLALSQPPMEVSYPSLKEIAGYRVIHPSEKGAIIGFALRKGILCAALRAGREEEAEWHPLDERGLASDFSKDAPPENDPTINPYETEKGVLLTEGPFAGKRLQAEWAGENRANGLWLLARNEQPVLVAPGIFSRPVVCPGGQWIVVAKTPDNEMWNVPNRVFRINLSSPKLFPVDIPAADNFDPVAWVAPRQRVLLHRAQDAEQSVAGSEASEFFLLDPFTGAHEKVSGEFHPVYDDAQHALQPTGSPNEFWAILNDEIGERRFSILGRYNLEQFRFRRVLTFPEVSLQSKDVWVDERNIWVTLNGDLLRFQMP